MKAPSPAASLATAFGSVLGFAIIPFAASHDSWGLGGMLFWLPWSSLQDLCNPYSTDRSTPILGDMEKITLLACADFLPLALLLLASIAKILSSKLFSWLYIFASLLTFAWLAYLWQSLFEYPMDRGNTLAWSIPYLGSSIAWIYFLYKYLRQLLTLTPPCNQLPPVLPS